MLRVVPVRMESGMSLFVYGQPMPAEEQPYIEPGTSKAGHERRRVLTSMGDHHTGAHAATWTQGTGVRVRIRVL